MSQFVDLAKEFKQLKSEIFQKGDFVVIDDPYDVRLTRYNQLLGYFYPQYRTSDWINPID